MKKLILIFAFVFILVPLVPLNQVFASTVSVINISSIQSKGIGVYPYDIPPNTDLGILKYNVNWVSGRIKVQLKNSAEAVIFNSVYLAGGSQNYQIDLSPYKNAVKLEIIVSSYMVEINTMSLYATAADPVPGLLTSKTLYRSDSTLTGGTALANLTDNNVDTVDLIGFNNNNFIRYDFPDPVNLSGYTVLGNTGQVIKLYFVKTDGTVSLISGDVGRNGAYTPVDYKDIKQVYLQNTGTVNVNLREFNVYGVLKPAPTPIPTATPLPTNTDLSLFVINDLNKATDSTTSLTLSWTPINSVYFKQYKVYQDEVLIGTVNQNSLSISGLVSGQSYTFKVTPVDTFDKEFTGATLSYTVPLPDTIPPLVPTSLKAVPDRYTAQLSWVAPPDLDLVGYYLYSNDVRVNPSPIQATHYTLTGLSPDMDYQVNIASVDTSGNISARSSPVSFKTLALESAPLTPQSFSALPFYQGANLSWLPSASADKYIIYLDDAELFRTDKTNGKVSNLTNGREYSFSVSAVNAVGESERSSTLLVKPTKQSMVDVTLGYNLQDLSDGTASMFGANWTLLAFAISIPLSFILALYVKQVFLQG